MSDDLFSQSPTQAPTGRAQRLTSVDQGSRIFSQWQGQFEQVTSGPFDGMLRVARSNLLRVVNVQVNQRVRTRGHDAANVFSAFPVIRGNADSLWQGQRLDPGQLVLNGTDSGVDHCTGRQSTVLGVFVCPRVLEHAARSLLAIDVVPLPKEWAACSPTVEAFDALNRVLSRFLDSGVATPEWLSTSEGSQFEKETLRWLINSLFPPSNLRSRLSTSVRFSIVRRAEELMRARLYDPVSAIEICRELNTSDRTLRLAFREHYGLGPMTYYRYLRLNAVRMALQRQPHRAIAELAREYGFQHLGNFASDYRRLFCHRPSQTQRRWQAL